MQRQRRFSKQLSQRKVFLVICEGETERTYIEFLKSYYRLPITIKTKISGNSINSRLVDQYIKELEIDKGDEIQIFYIYDSDVEYVVTKLSKLKGTPILTNPCFELWYLLHVCDHNREIKSKDLQKVLSVAHTKWESYTKGRLNTEQKQFLLEHTSDAIKRSKRLNYPHNPSTNLYEFIEALENA